MKIHDPKIFGQRLRVARVAHELTLEQLAAMTGIKPSSLARYERGEARPREQRIKSLLFSLCVDFEWLNKPVKWKPRQSD